MGYAMREIRRQDAIRGPIVTADAERAWNEAMKKAKELGLDVHGEEASRMASHAANAVYKAAAAAKAETEAKRAAEEVDSD